MRKRYIVAVFLLVFMICAVGCDQIAKEAWVTKKDYSSGYLTTTMMYNTNSNSYSPQLEYVPEEWNLEIKDQENRVATIEVSKEFYDKVQVGDKVCRNNKGDWEKEEQNKN